MSRARAWGLLLQLYPAKYRHLFGDEMLRVIEMSQQERGTWIQETFGLLAGARREWAARWREGGGYMRQHDEEVQEGTKNVLAVQKLIERNLRLMEHAIANHDFPRARFYSQADLKFREKLGKLQSPGDLA